MDSGPATADSNIITLLADNQKLTPKARTDVFERLIDCLPRHDFRRIKSRFELETFQCDIIARLPIELVILVFRHLSSKHLLVLQRVSRTWKARLSSYTVQHAVICSLGPWFDNGIINNTAAFIKKRVRIEEGLLRRRLPSHLPVKVIFRGVKLLITPKATWYGLTAQERHCLWSTSGQVRVVSAHSAPTLCIFPTSRCRVSLSRRSANKLATFGVWKTGSTPVFICLTPIQVGPEDLSFMVQRLCFWAIPRLEGIFFIHWSFESRTTYTIPWWKEPQTIRTLILDPNEDKFIVLHLSSFPDSDDTDPVETETTPVMGQHSTGPTHFENTEAHIETLALDEEGGEFQFKSHKTKKLFLRRDSCVRGTVSHCVSHPGQLNINIEEESMDDEIDSDDDDSNVYLNSAQLFFSLGKNQRLIVHKAHTGRTDNVKIVSPGPGIVYCSGFVVSPFLQFDEGNRSVILHASDQDDSLVCDYDFRDQLWEGTCGTIYGDGDFVIFVDESKMVVYSFNEWVVWNPRGIEWPEKILPD